MAVAGLPFEVQTLAFIGGVEQLVRLQLNPNQLNNQIHRAVTRELTAKGLREVKPGKSRLSGALLGLRELLRRMKVQAESKGLSSTKMGDPPKVQPSLPSLWTEAWPQRSLPPIRTNWDTSRSIICG
jgi:hypothetical protein